jgi:hypothetical protein
MEKITIMKVVTFSTENIKADLATNKSKQVSTITDEEIIECAWEWAYQVFGDGEGLIMIDENGEQL